MQLEWKKVTQTESLQNDRLVDLRNASNNSPTTSPYPPSSPISSCACFLFWPETEFSTERIALVLDSDAKLNHFPRCGLLQNRNEVLCLSLVIRYLSDYAGSGVQLGPNRDDPRRTAHKISFSSLGMLLQMIVCRGVWNQSCSTESSDLTFCNPNFNKLAALDFPVLFLVKPALLHGAVWNESWKF